MHTPKHLPKGGAHPAKGQAHLDKLKNSIQTKSSGKMASVSSVSLGTTHGSAHVAHAVRGGKANTVKSK